MSANIHVEPEWCHDIVQAFFATVPTNGSHAGRTFRGGMPACSCRLGVPDLIAKGQPLSKRSQQRPVSRVFTLSAVAHARQHWRIFRELSGSVPINSLGETLRSDAADFLRDKAIFEISTPMWSAWGSLLDVLRSGAPSFPQVHNATVYEYLATHADLGVVFNRFMTAQSHLHNAAIADAYDFSDVRTLVDVGGGHGATLTALLERYPTMTGILFDLPEVVARARWEASEGRCKVIGGDMLQSVPTGGDVYLIKRVMMDKTDEEAITVLRNCIASMNKAGKYS